MIYELRMTKKAFSKIGAFWVSGETRMINLWTRNGELCSNFRITSKAWPTQKQQLQRFTLEKHFLKLEPCHKQKEIRWNHVIYVYTVQYSSSKQWAVLVEENLVWTEKTARIGYLLQWLCLFRGQGCRPKMAQVSMAKEHSVWKIGWMIQQ